MPTRATRMTANDALETQSQTANHPVTLQSFDRVLRTGGMKTATWWQQRADHHPVELDERDAQVF